MNKTVKISLALGLILLLVACKDTPADSISTIPQISSSTIASTDIPSTTVEVSSEVSSDISSEVSSDIDSTDISSETVDSSSGGLVVSENTDSGDWGPIYG